MTDLSPCGARSSASRKAPTFHRVPDPLDPMQPDPPDHITRSLSLSVPAIEPLTAFDPTHLNRLTTSPAPPAPGPRIASLSVARNGVPDATEGKRWASGGIPGRQHKCIRLAIVGTLFLGRQLLCAPGVRADPDLPGRFSTEIFYYCSLRFSSPSPEF